MIRFIVPACFLMALAGSGQAFQDDKAEAKDKDAGNVYVPKDGKSFDITEKDVVRFTGPSQGSTGIKTEVKVTMGEATVTKRPVYSVVDGKVVTIGGGASEFDVKPAAGKKGKIKVTVTTTPPGSDKGEVKQYEFEVK